MENEKEKTDTTPIRQDIRVLPNDHDGLRLGFSMYEWPFDPESLSDEAKEMWEEQKQRVWDEINKYPAYRTNESDKYFSTSGVHVDDVKKYIISFDSISILENLKGHPWNNLALSYVLAFEPKIIRVTFRGITLDAYPGRITVYLEEDKRTIKSIEKEVSIPCIGAQNGNHLKRLLNDPEAQPSFQSVIYINDEVINNNNEK